MTAYPMLVQRSLSAGWEFKENDDEATAGWMPAPVVPSVVQQDLQANQRYIGLIARGMGHTLLTKLQTQGPLYRVQ